MSATTGALNGTLLGLHVDESGTLKKVANLMSNDFKFAVDTIEVSSKSSGGHKEYIAGDDGSSFSYSAIMEEDASVGSSEKSYLDMYTLAAAKSPISVVWGSGVVGDVKFSCSVIIQSVDMSAPYNDKATYTGTMITTGAITQSTFS